MGHSAQRVWPLPGHRSGVSRGFPNETQPESPLHQPVILILLTMTADKALGHRRLADRTPKTIRAGIEASKLDMSRLTRTPIYGLILVLTVSFSALTFPLQARVQLDIVAKFRNAGIELDIVTVVDSEVEASKSKAALLGIATPLRSSFSFRREEWLLLIDLWSKAVKAQSDSWKIIGSMKETETSDDSVLIISAGPGIKFVINSSRKGLVAYVLSKDDLARFAGTLYRVKEFFS
jgi:hypothetical protein